MKSLFTIFQFSLHQILVEGIIVTSAEISNIKPITFGFPLCVKCYRKINKQTNKHSDILADTFPDTHTDAIIFTFIFQ